MINNVQMMGRIASDLRLYEYQSGKKKMCFAIALNQTGYKTEFFECETWSPTTIQYWQDRKIGKGWLIFIEKASLHRYRGKREDGTYIDRCTINIKSSFPVKSPHQKSEDVLEALGEEVDVVEEGFEDW